LTVKLDNEQLLGYLRAIVNADASTRKTVVDEFTVFLLETETFEVWGRGLAKRYNRVDDWEDITSVVTEAVMRALGSVDALLLEKVQSPAAWLYYAAKSEVQLWIDSPAVTIASKMSGISRRHRQAMSAAAELREQLGRTPEASEIVEYANNKAMANRTDAAKQGALISVEDVEGTHLRAYSMDYQPSTGDGSSGPNESFGTPVDNVTIRAELTLTVARLGTIAAARYPEDAEPVKTALAVWSELVIDGETPTPRRIARAMRITLPRATELLSRVDSVLESYRDESAA